MRVLWTRNDCQLWDVRFACRRWVNLFLPCTTDAQSPAKQYYYILDVYIVLQTEDELEREVVEILQKALKYCDTETPGPRQPIYQFRAATIQHRLGSLYHRVYRELKADTDNPKRKNSLQLSKLYYMKAAKLFLSLEQPGEFLTVQLERLALVEHQAESM